MRWYLYCNYVTGDSREGDAQEHHEFREFITEWNARKRLQQIESDGRVIRAWLVCGDVKYAFEHGEELT